MNKIQSLIDQHCPNDAMLETLGNVATIKRGIRLIKSQLGKDGKYPVYQNSMTPLGYHEKSNRPAHSVFAIGAGAAGEIGYSMIDFWAADDCFCFDCSEVLQSRYLYYALLCRQNHIFSRVRRASVPRLSRSVFEQLSIPIPPLEVQSEIVSLLDKFTALIAELKAELEARRKQYEYYRCKLLDFNETEKDILWLTLKETGTFYGGLTGKSITDFSDGNAKFVTYTNVFSNIAVNTEINDFVRISPSEKQNRIAFGDILFTGSSETPGESGMSSVMTKRIDYDLYLNSFCFGLRLNEKYRDLLSPEFAKHLFRSKKIRKQIVATASGVTRFNVSKKRMESVKIPIPPRATQDRIVAVLDTFDTLVNDFSVGLPAEIRMRQRQYEYYRNSLIRLQYVTSSI